MAHVLEKKWRSEDVKLEENVDFSALLLSDRVLYGLKKAGFRKPSPIQLEAIPLSKVGKDLLVQAKSGTGKTLVFVITALEMLRRKMFRPQVIIIVPTREIAFQICYVVKSVGAGFPKLTCFSFIGGLSVSDDIENAGTCQIVVGTPGRLKQLITEKALPVNSIRLLVFDEADQLLKLSFKQDLDNIYNLLPDDKQVIATSATYPEKFKKLLLKYLREPHVACLNSRQIALLGIIHYIKVIKNTPLPVIEYKNKLSILEGLLKKIKFTQCLVFCNSILRVDMLYKDIKKWGFSVACISSAKEQHDRLKAIERLKRFKCKVLVSSDLSSRGIDAENVDLIVNFDLAFGADTYMHRSGRAGRYGSMGVAVSVVSEKELIQLHNIEKTVSFKTYKLPDPIPADLIQNKCLGEYAIDDTTSEVSDDSDQKSEKLEGDKTNGLDYVKNDVFADNTCGLIENSNVESVETKLQMNDKSSDEKEYVLTEVDTVDKVSNSPEFVNCSKEEIVTPEIASNKTKTKSFANSVPSKNVDVCNISITEEESSEHVICSENEEFVSDIQCMNDKNRDIVYIGSENHYFNEDFGGELGISLSDSDCPSFEHVDIKHNAQDVGFASDIYISSEFDKGDLNHIICTFLDAYESKDSTDSATLNDKAEENSEIEHISVCVNDLNSKKTSYIYQICKKYKEDEAKETCETSCIVKEMEKDCVFEAINAQSTDRKSVSEKFSPGTLKSCGTTCLDAKSFKLNSCLAQSDISNGIVYETELKNSFIQPSQVPKPLKCTEPEHFQNSCHKQNPRNISQVDSVNQMCSDTKSEEMRCSKYLFEATESESDDTAFDDDIEDSLSLSDTGIESSSCSSSSVSSSEGNNNAFYSGKRNPSLILNSASQSKGGSISCYRQDHRSQRCPQSCSSICCEQSSSFCLRNYSTCLRDKRCNTAHGCTGQKNYLQCSKSRRPKAVPESANRACNHCMHLSFTGKNRHLYSCGKCSSCSAKQVTHNALYTQSLVYSQWKRTFDMQWRHLQNCVNSTMM